MLTKDDLRALAKWVNEVESYGIEHVHSEYWNDNPLEAEWTGLGSASFSLRGRIIYRIEAGRLIVMVVRIAATHNCKK